MKHILRFAIESPSGMREFALETDELRDVSNQAWFMEFMGIGAAASYTPPRSEAPQASQTELYAAMAQQQRAIEELRQMVSRGMQPRQETQVQAPVQATQPVARGPSSQTFMDISPDAMSEVVWNRMSPQQQGEWMQKWQVQ